MKKSWRLAVLAIVFFIACGGGNQAPVINSVTTDLTFACQSDEAHLVCNASDPDGDSIMYTWTAESGALSSTTGWSTTWTPSADTGPQTISVIVEDEGELADTGTVVINVYIPLSTGANNDTLVIPPNGYVESDIAISGALSNAEIDSVTLTVDITAALPEYFTVELTSAEGTLAMVWDAGDFPGGVATRTSYAFAGEDVNGTWRLRVRSYFAQTGTLNGWQLAIYWSLP